MTMAEARATLAQSTPETFEAHCEELAQSLAWAGPGETEALAEICEAHPARLAPAGAERWVRGTFLVLGREATALLEAHAASPDGTEYSRQLARDLSTELAREERLTQGAGGSLPSNGEGRFRLDDPAFSGSDLIELFSGWSVDRDFDALVASGIAPVVATDCDGTTWRHDIGEALVRAAVQNRWLLPQGAAASARVLELFGLSATGEANADAGNLLKRFEAGDLHARGAALGMDPREVNRLAYEAATACFAGHPIARIKQWTAEIFEAGFADNLFPGIRDVLGAARSAGLIPVAVSASCQWMVEVAARTLDIPPWRVWGLRTHIEDGCLTDEVIEPVTYGPGKIDVLRARWGHPLRPLVGMGDSVFGTDRELLQASLVKLAVEPQATDEPALAQARAAGENWGVVRYGESV